MVAVHHKEVDILVQRLLDNRLLEELVGLLDGVAPGLGQEGTARREPQCRAGIEEGCFSLDFDEEDWGDLGDDEVDKPVGHRIGPADIV